MLPGATIELGILRDGKPQTVSVKVGEFSRNAEVASESDPAGAKGGKLGLGIGDLTSDLRQQMKLPEQLHGVAVENVRPGSPAEDAGLAPGDVILEVNRKPVPSADQFVNAVHANPNGKDLLLLVWSKGNSSYRVVHPDQG